MITVGDSFIKPQAVGLGTTTTSGRNAGVSTAPGTIIYNAQTGNVQVYKTINGWQDITHSGDDPPTGLTASGGLINDYVDGSNTYRAHIFTGSGTFNVTALATDPNISDSVEYLVVAGGGAGQHGGGGAGGLRTNLSGHPLAGAAFPVSTSPGSYTVTVGGGGGGTQGPSPPEA